MRPIPGTNEVEGRGFAYLECKTADVFRLISPKIAIYGEGPIPRSGGAINEDFALVLPGGVRLFALSYKGDLAGWRRKVVEYAEAFRQKFGEISGDFIQLEGGEMVPLANCKIEDNSKSPG